MLALILLKSEAHYKYMVMSPKKKKQMLDMNVPKQKSIYDVSQYAIAI